MKRQQRESVLAQHVADYLELKYPNVIRRFDLAADLKLTIGQASRHKRMHGKKSKGFPDLFIAMPNKYYHGLFLELKAGYENLYRKDGTIRQTEHLKTQCERHNDLRDAGYEVKFATSLKDAINVIEKYMENR